MRLLSSAFLLTTSGLVLLFGGACSDWTSLYGEPCNGEWIEDGADCPADELESRGGTGAGGDETGTGGDATDEPLCGNETLDEGEICDDGNAKNDDGCLAGCSRASCGDGFKRVGVEECDDGNLLDADECNRSCLVRGPDDYGTSFSDHLYTYYETPVPFADAYETCARAGGYLWGSNTAGENRQVQRNGLPENTEVWTGLKLLGATYSDPTGSVASYLPWVAGEPSTGECVVQFGSAPDNLENFATRSCDEPRPFACEREPAKTNPTTHHAYRRWFLRLSQEEAANFCEQEGGHLVAAETAAERSFLSAFQAPFWVNAVRTSEDYEWLLDRSQLADEDFGEGADDQTGNDCVYQEGGLLWPGPCNEARIFVCEFE